jgi:multidrug resistance efflux pump
MTTPHIPEPEFVRHLEWQLQSELRRRSRWPAARPRGAAKLLRLAALVLASALLGAATAVGTAQIQDAAEKKLWLARATVEVDTAQLELQNAEVSLQHAVQLQERGFVTRADLDEARRRHAAAARQLKTAQRHREEIETTGRRPDEGLDAPLVGGRDFVAERLQSDLEDARAAVADQEQRVAESKKLRERGFTSEGDLRVASAALRRAEIAVRSLEQRAELRSRHLRGEIPGREVALREKRLELKSRLAELEDARDQQELRLAHTRVLRQKSFVSEQEQRTDELELQRLLDLIKITILEIELVDAKLK